MKPHQLLTSSTLLCLPLLSFAAPCTQNKSIVSVYTTATASHEYVIFKVKAPSSSYVVPYFVNTVTGPFSNGTSGNPITVNGMAFKQINFTSAFWTCTIHEIFSTLPRTTIKDVKKQEQFEGQVHYIVGYDNTPPPKNYLNSYQFTAGAYKKVVMRFRK